jgi:hypothetical protein
MADEVKGRVAEIEKRANTDLAVERNGYLPTEMMGVQQKYFVRIQKETLELIATIRTLQADLQSVRRLTIKYHGLGMKDPAQWRVGLEEIASVVAEEGAEAEPENLEFLRGYVLAVCNLNNMHDMPSVAWDVLLQLGVTKAEIKRLDLSEYDAKALRKIENCGQAGTPYADGRSRAHRTTVLKEQSHDQS